MTAIEEQHAQAAMKGHEHLGLYAILFASFAWGTTGTAASFAPEVSPFAIGAAAMGIGGLLQALRSHSALRREAAGIRREARLWLIGALCVALYPLAFYASMRLAGVAIGTVISIASGPVFAALIEWAVEGKRLSPRWLVAAAISILGMALLTLSHETSAELSQINLGVVLGLCAGASYAAYSFTARKMMLRGLSAAAAMGATFGLGGALLMPVLVLTGAAFLDNLQNFAVGAYMALIPMFLGYVAFGYGLARVTISTATMITLVEPAVAALLAVAILGEALSAWGWMGIGLLCLGLLVLTLPLKR